MAFKFKLPGTTSEKNIKTIHVGPGDHRVGKIVWLEDGEQKQPYIIKYPIVGNIENGTITEGSLPFGGQVTLTINPDAGYLPPALIEVTNANVSGYNEEKGILVLNKPTPRAESIIVKGACVFYGSYSITVDMNNTGTWDGDKHIEASSEAEITIIPDKENKLPPQIDGYITIENANIASYDNTTGTIIINKPEGEVSLNITCPGPDQLEAPEITISDDTLYIMDWEGKATQFDIYVDDEYKITVDKTE